MTALRQPGPGSAGVLWRRMVPVWLVLLGLLGLTLALAYQPLGRLAGPVALGIAALKAMVVALWFMQLRRPDPLLRLAASVSLVWVAFLFALTLSDLLTRTAVQVRS